MVCDATIMLPIERHAAAVQRIGFDRIDLALRPPPGDHFAGDTEYDAAGQRHQNRQPRIERKPPRQSLARRQIEEHLMEDVDADAHAGHDRSAKHADQGRQQDQARFSRPHDGAQTPRNLQSGFSNQGASPAEPYRPRLVHPSNLARSTPCRIPFVKFWRRPPQWLLPSSPSRCSPRPARVCSKARPHSATGTAIIRVCAGSSGRKTCHRRTRPNRRGISSDKCAAPTKSQSSQTASKSTYLPRVSPSRASSAWRRTATCSSPKAARGASACCGRAATARRQPSLFASGLHYPFGIAFYPAGADPQWVYVGDTDAVVRFPYRNGDLAARGPAEVVVPHLPVGGHSTRDVVFSPDGKTMYVSVGSESNAATAWRS